jgi:hypothetical protein
MPPIWIAFYAAIAAIVGFGIFDSFVLQPRRWRARYGADWHAHNTGAFHPRVSDPGKNNTRTIVRVAEEVISNGRKRAITIENGYGGIVVHEFSKTGQCSTRGPYYIRLRGSVWRFTGRRHLVETIRHPSSVKTSNPSGGQTREVGKRILEFDTAKYPPISLKEFALSKAKRG